MENFKLLKQGAEAKLSVGKYLGKPTIAKERFKKNYRHSELDRTLSKERIKAECRAILKCKNIGITTPTLYLVDMQRQTIFMEYFDCSITAKDFIFKADDTLIEKLSVNIGQALAKMHSNNITHGDLTTSNILLINKNKEDKFYDNFDELKLVFIDFGLAHLECSAEDKGVDLYVLERALLSTHSVAEQIFPSILKAYEQSYKNGCKDVLAKFEEVRARGRKRTMVG